MKNRKHFGIYLALLGGGLLIFVYQNNSKPYASTTATSRTATAAFPVYPASLEELTNFQSAATGNQFSGKKFRTFTDFAFRDGIEKSKILSGISFSYSNREKDSINRPPCDKWGVMTTISSPPTEAVRRFFYKQDWCVVVVGDLNKPKDFVMESTLGSNIIFLSSEDQKQMSNDFVDSLPWKSFGRKNVGYLYAIARGAKVIWDFDDDNFLKFWIDGAATDKSLDLQTYSNTNPDYSVEVAEPEFHANSSSISFNPYPILGSPTNTSWPRGLPLSDILNSDSWNATLGKRTTVRLTTTFGVLQSLADIQPDVDAIFRMTQQTPFMFRRPQNDPNAERPILKVPSDRITPYNAQATIHFYNAFWALYLPVTVAGRVSDIWRSFVAQALFKPLGLSVGFLPRPIVVQERNPHSYEADFAAELPLYIQGHAFASHVVEQYLTKKDPVEDLPKSIEELWVDLYERGFVEIEDVFLVQRWLKTLHDIGYKFPNTKNSQSVVYAEQVKIASVGSTVQELSKAYYAEYYKHSSFRTSTCIHNQADAGSPLIFANSDLHTGPRADLSSLLSHLGQLMVLMGYKGNETNYPEIYKHKSVKIYNKNSPTLMRYQDHSHRLTPLGISKNIEYYADDEGMKNIDAFICTFPASMCQMWQALNKTIVFLPAHRYNLGRCTTKEWRGLDDDLKKLVADPSDRHTIAAVSRYDAEYLRYYTGIQPTLLSSFSGYYTPVDSYRPTRKEYLIFNLKLGAFNFSQTVINVLAPEYQAARVYDLYNFYTLQDLTSHPAVIMLPYSVMSYRLTELYTMGIPLFIPSPKFYRYHYDPDTKRYGIGHDRTSTSEPYCSMQYNLEVTMRPLTQSNLSSHPYSPNIDFFDDPESEMYWMQLADFYDWPHTQKYDSYQHLKMLLGSTDLPQIHNLMLEEVELRGLQLNRKWCDVIKRIKDSKVIGKI